MLGTNENLVCGDCFLKGDSVLYYHHQNKVICEDCYSKICNDQYRKCNKCSDNICQKCNDKDVCLNCDDRYESEFDHLELFDDCEICVNDICKKCCPNKICDVCMK